LKGEIKFLVILHETNSNKNTYFIVLNALFRDD
jgi:hypothetical protein